MNVANVIPLGAPHAVPHAGSGHPAALNPVRARFDRFELDEAEARLTCAGEPVALAPKPFAVLCALARTPGSLVTKNALLDLVWGHRFVTESVLKTAISEVRAALGDDPRQPRYIETVSRRGYRFIAATVGATSQRASAVERNVAVGRDHPALTALTALCRGDAALAELIRSGRRHAGARAACPQRVLAGSRRMKPSEQRLSEARRQQTEAIVARHVHELFKRLPMLSGFWLRPDLEWPSSRSSLGRATPPARICTRK